MSGWETVTDATINHTVDGTAMYAILIGLEGMNATTDARFAKFVVTYEASDVDKTL